MKQLQGYLALCTNGWKMSYGANIIGGICPGGECPAGRCPQKIITINDNNTKTESNMKETKVIFFRVLMEPHGYPWISHFRGGYTVIAKLQSYFHEL